MICEFVSVVAKDLMLAENVDMLCDMCVGCKLKHHIVIALSISINDMLFVICIVWTMPDGYPKPDGYPMGTGMGIGSYPQQLVGTGIFHGRGYEIGPGIVVPDQ